MLAQGGVAVLYLAVFVFVFVLAAAFSDLLLALARGEFGWLKKRFEKRLWSVGPPLTLLAAVLLTLAVT